MNNIDKTLDVVKLSNPGVEDISRDSLLKEEHVDFITDIIKREVPVLVVYDRDTDGTTGLVGGLHASQNGILPKSWRHSYSWSNGDRGRNVPVIKDPTQEGDEDEGSSGGTFGASKDQIVAFFESNKLEAEAEAVIFTVDNGATTETLQQEVKAIYPNVKFFITDHHISTDRTREVSDFYINPSDDYNKGISNWATFTNAETGNVEESHVSGGMLWNLILKEISFYVKNPEAKGKPKHQLILDNPDDFHTRAGLLSQWCDLITYSADWEESFRVNLENGNLQKLPIFKYVKSLEWSGMTDENWVQTFRDRIRKVSSVINTTKRLDFLITNDDYEGTLKETGLDMEILNKKFKPSLVDVLTEYNEIVKVELEKDFPSIHLGELAPLKYIYIYAIKDSSNPKIMEIIEKLAELKNFLMKVNDYSMESMESTQFFFTENPIMRGITSIRSFIDKDRPVLFNMAPSGYDDATGMELMRGSYRSDLESLFSTINDYEFKNGTLKLMGHERAAGSEITFKPGDRDLFYKEIDELVTKTIEKENYQEPKLLNVTYEDVKNSADNIIQNQNYYVFSPPMKFNMTVADLITKNGIETRTSKNTGTEYINNKDYKGNVSVLGFNLGEYEDDYIIETEISVIPNKNKPMVQIMVRNISKPDFDEKKQEKKQKKTSRTKKITI